MDVVGSIYGGRSASVYSGNPKTGLALMEEIAMGGHWWEELYVAEKMKQNPKLRDSQLIEQLKESKNPVVRATIQEIEDGKN